jgi:putative Mn2+ efflux pump MntP
VAAVCVLGFLLGLDSLRASLALGASPMGRGRRVRIALTFGLCDALAPLLGLALGQAFVSKVAPWAKHCGVLALAGYGASLLFAAPRTAADAEPPVGDGGRFLPIGLPVVLGLDNLIAGFGLGTLGPPVVLSAAVLGVISGLMSLLGLCMGQAAGDVVPESAGRLGGGALISVALAGYFD